MARQSTYSWILLIAFLAITAGVAFIGSQFRPGPWYEALAKPDWTPPNWLFGPVWTLLYIMIAIAGWLVFKRRPLASANIFWAAQMVVNALWSWFFFGEQRVDLAMIDIAALWIMILAFIFSAWRISKTASLLFVPYLAWVGYATALNFAIWQLNA